MEILKRALSTFICFNPIYNDCEYQVIINSFLNFITLKYLQNFKFISQVSMQMFDNTNIYNHQLTLRAYKQAGAELSGKICLHFQKELRDIFLPTNVVNIHGFQKLSDQMFLKCLTCNKIQSMYN
jgi:hypothetical protein